MSSLKNIGEFPEVEASQSKTSCFLYVNKCLNVALVIIFIVTLIFGFLFLLKTFPAVHSFSLRYLAYPFFSISVLCIAVKTIKCFACCFMKRGEKRALQEESRRNAAQMQLTMFRRYSDASIIEGEGQTLYRFHFILIDNQQIYFNLTEEEYKLLKWATCEDQPDLVLNTKSVQRVAEMRKLINKVVSQADKEKKEKKYRKKLVHWYLRFLLRNPFTVYKKKMGKHSI